MSVEEMEFWQSLTGQMLELIQVLALAYLAVLAKRADDTTRRTARKLEEES